MCRAQRAHFSDYLDGAPLPWWRRLLVSFHARYCPACRPLYRSLEATQEALSALHTHDE
jgi:predicted anti-sigma-YlaC factor YlaD